MFSLRGSGDVLRTFDSDLMVEHLESHKSFTEGYSGILPANSDKLKNTEIFVHSWTIGLGTLDVAVSESTKGNYNEAVESQVLLLPLGLQKLLVGKIGHEQILLLLSESVPPLSILKDEVGVAS